MSVLLAAANKVLNLDTQLSTPVLVLSFQTTTLTITPDPTLSFTTDKPLTD